MLIYGCNVFFIAEHISVVNLSRPQPKCIHKWFKTTKIMYLPDLWEENIRKGFLGKQDSFLWLIWIVLHLKVSTRESEPEKLIRLVVYTLSSIVNCPYERPYCFCTTCRQSIIRGRGGGLDSKIINFANMGFLVSEILVF